MRGLTKDDSLYGPMHGTWDAKKTLCDKEIDWQWWLFEAGKDDEAKVTCKRCLNVMTRGDNQ